MTSASRIFSKFNLLSVGRYLLLVVIGSIAFKLLFSSSIVQWQQSDSSVDIQAREQEQAESYDWFESSWARGLTVPYQNQFVGDMPLYPPCKHSKKTENSIRFPFIEPPKNLLLNSKNPCWFEKKELRCLPYFYIPAVAKAGTSDLFRRIRMHPDVMMGTQKEYHFWDEERFANVIGVWARDGDDQEDIQPHIAPNLGAMSFDDYIHKICNKKGIEQILADLKANGTSVKLFGDGTPSTMRSTGSWPLLEGNEGCLEPRMVVGQHVRHVYPAAKQIYIFRHPTTRLYSRFLSRIPRTPSLKHATREDFHNYVVKGIALYKECFRRYSLRRCAYNGTLRVQAIVRLNEGMYPVYLADWLRIFHKEQSLFLRSEDYKKDLEGTLDKVFYFLGLAPVRGATRTEIMSHVVVNSGSDQYQSIGPMKTETIRLLDNFYEPFVRKTAELLKDRRFLWRDVYNSTAVEG